MNVFVLLNLAVSLSLPIESCPCLNCLRFIDFTSSLKRLVSEIDPNAFVIVQEAHQVLGDGFSRYSKEEL